MKGIVRYFLPERCFGFLKYSSAPGSGRLDREAYFRDTALRAFVQAGDPVEFDLGLGENEREQAIAVTPLNDRQSGVVVTTGRKSYCYIAVDGRTQTANRYFAHLMMCFQIPTPENARFLSEHG